MSYYNESALSHHGIKGQKWGVRRFQKKDGSLTTAGKSRYGFVPSSEEQESIKKELLDSYSSRDLALLRKSKSRSQSKKSAARNKKTIDNEIEFQNKKINEHEKAAKAYRDSAEEIRKSGYDLLRKQGYSDKDARDAVDAVIKRRENEARWNEHQVEHLKIYNKKLSEIDVSTVSNFQVNMLIRTLGKTTVDEINNSWKE